MDKSNKANLGKEWEDSIIRKCNQYRKEKRALIIKIPTEMVLIRKFGKVVSAFPREKAFLDFVGSLSDGRCLFIEAKSTKNKTSFPLNLIKEHQYELCEEISNHTNLCFYLIHFKTLKKSYLIHSSRIQMFIKNNTRKSLPVQWLDEHAIQLGDELDFLTHIENFIL